MLPSIEKVLFLKKVNLFHQLNSKDSRMVSAIAHEVMFKKGEIIIQEGDLGGCLYLIIEGEVDIMIDNKRIVAQRQSRQVLGDMAVLNDRTRTASCVTKTPTRALKLSNTNFMNFCGKNQRLVSAS